VCCPYCSTAEGHAVLCSAVGCLPELKHQPPLLPPLPPAGSMAASYSVHTPRTLSLSLCFLLLSLRDRMEGHGFVLFCLSCSSPSDLCSLEAQCDRCGDVKTCYVIYSKIRAISIDGGVCVCARVQYTHT
jgi:hypothetical protein